MPPRPIHLIEAGIVTEQRYAGLAGGPTALAAACLAELRPDKRIRVPFNPRDRWLTAAREACRTLADAVQASLAAGGFPIVLGGECTLVAGSLSGALAEIEDLHLVYVDAHADFHTLATTKTHEVAGMCLAHVCAYPVAALLWPGSRRIASERVVLVGARALDPGEAGNLVRTKVHRVPFDATHRDAPGLVAAVRRKTVWLHVDVDVIDPSACAAVAQPAEDGPPVRAVADVLRAVAGVASVRGVELCGYDPTKNAGEPTLPGVLAKLLAEVCAPAPA